MYLLITNKSVINKAQQEADNLLIKFCGRRQSNSTQNLPEKKRRYLSSITKSHPIQPHYQKTPHRLLLNQ